MKLISIVVPTYNEEDNVKELSQEITKIMANHLPNYKYEVIFIDNDSHDKTREILRKMCSEDCHIKAIFNSRNFGQNNSPYYGMLQATGDAVIAMSADFQDPPEMIPKFVKIWEEGYEIVTAIKTSSKENTIVRFARTIYYRMLRKMSDTEIIEHFTGFGLYDRKFIEFMRNLKDPIPFLRGVVAEYGGKRKEIEFEQPKRRAGKTHNNFFTLYDIAMRSFTSYTKIGLRLATFAGFVIAGISFAIALVYLILKLINWNSFNMGTAPILLGIFFLGSVQLIFLGLIGEYILAINQRVMNRPLVIESERLNFDLNQEIDEDKSC
jgi:glycosyltransferase involved in cell wall biosynthesis